MSLDRAIRVVFPLQNILIAVSNTASAAAIFHPNGRVVQNSSRVDVVAHDGVRHNNYLLETYILLYFSPLTEIKMRFFFVGDMRKCGTKV